MTRRAAPTRWFGGKHGLAAAIADLLPRHRTYVEPFGGSGAVLFTKARAALDVWNDVDDGLVTFYRALRDRPEELAQALRLTPYARREWRRCRETWREATDDVERARAWFVTVNQGFGAEPVATGWASERTGRARISRALSFANGVDDLLAYAERWRGVQIESIDWRACLERYDDDGACFYLDPPYLPETRSSGGYAHELTAADHAELIELVRDLRAGVVLSGYDSALYRGLEAAGFERFEFSTYCAAARLPGGPGQSRSTRLEVVWRRGDVPAARLFGAIA